MERIPLIANGMHHVEYIQQLNILNKLHQPNLGENPMMGIISRFRWILLPLSVVALVLTTSIAPSVSFLFFVTTLLAIWTPPSGKASMRRSSQLILTALLAAMAIFNLASQSASDLEVVRTPSGVLTIQNKGTGPVEILAVTVNDRPDCKAFQGAFAGSEFKGPKMIPVGDYILVSSPACPIVRTSITTTKGTWTYRF